jgi:hypothetical protein
MQLNVSQAHFDGKIIACESALLEQHQPELKAR